MLKSAILAVLAAVPFVPFLVLYFIRTCLSLIGTAFSARTASRREAIYIQYRRDTKQNKDLQEKKGTAGQHTIPNGVQKSDWAGIVGFFHPFCNAGGGGERVLWAAIAATQRKYPKAICAVYTGDHEIEPTSMVAKVKDRFDIKLKGQTLLFIYLSQRHYVLPSTWPHFTLLGQSIGSIILAFDAFSLLVPDIFIDTMGYAYAVALCKLLFPKVPTAAYVHYPTISTDMLESLDDTTGGKGIHSGLGAGYRGKAKKVYWHAFAWTYGWVGRQIDVVMCNSTWTSNHITQLWSRGKNSKRPATVVYPPCPVEELESKIDVSLSSEHIRTKENIVLYIAQYRPEKNHEKILRAFAKYYRSTPNSTARLVLIGSVRADTSDGRHIYNLRLLAETELKIRGVTTFICDASFSTILQYLQKSSIGVNGMYSEHFGIGNVEGLAAGLIPVVHNSGGPKLDIVVPDDNGDIIGFHAESIDDYAEAFTKVAALTEEQRLSMRLRGRNSAKRFTEDVFVRKWDKEMEDLVRMTKL